MSKADEKPGESFKRATVGCVKALAKAPDLEVTFSSTTAQTGADKLRLATPAVDASPEQRRLYRGMVDRQAIRLCYHDQRLHARLNPTNPLASRLFESLEEARTEALGTRHMAGVRANLDADLMQSLEAEGINKIRIASESTLPSVVRLLGRMALSQMEIPDTMKPAVAAWRGQLPAEITEALSKLGPLIEDQKRFGQAARTLIQDYLLPPNTLTDRPDDLIDENDEAIDIEDQQPRQQTSETDESRVEETMESSEASESTDSEDQELDSDQTEMSEGNPTEGADVMMGDPRNWRPEHDLAGIGREKFYHVFTQRFDEIIQAHDLCDEAELTKLRQQLDSQLSQLQGVVAKLANRLQRKLMAQQQRSWAFDLEEGYLDTARLSRLVTDPSYPLSYKMEKETEFRDTVVTLLIDNSGSMRGRPITIAAVSADILARTLERCGVKVEILGFTTTAWKGGQSREQWVKSDKPANPGRLNDLRHIIYKSADAPYRRTRRNLALMLREGLLKENIDGEALLWAHQRLLARPEERRILMVISDGAPVDDSTLSVNSGNYLERHLRDVITDIEKTSRIELVAIGIGHDVTRYYKRAVTIVDVGQLGGAMMAQLADLFG